MTLPVKRTSEDVIQYSSGYSLHLYCDHENPRHGFQEFPHEFTGETFTGCAKVAKRRGWRINTDARTATCPKCTGAKK